MASRFGSVGTMVLAAGVATCGLFMLSGVGPSAANEVQLPTVAPNSTDETAPDIPDDESTEEGTEVTTASTTAITTTTTPAGTTTTPTSTTTSTTTVTPTSTTTVTPTTTVAASPIPLSVTASNAVVGAGGTITFDGVCATSSGQPLGAITVWVVPGDGGDVDVIETGLSSATWTFTWTAPSDEDAFGSFVFQFWCGDPAGFEAGYPLDLQRRVDMVASAAPPTTVPLVESQPVTPTIPETD